MADPIPLKPGARVRAGMKRGAADERGRLPAHRPTDQQREVVTVLASNSTTQVIIAQALGIDPQTLKRHYAKEIEYGRAHIVAKVGMVVVKEALAGNMAAARYWLTTHGGPEWRMPMNSTYTDPDEARGEAGDVVHFYMPPNHRDEPEPDEVPPTIDGTAEKTGTDGA